MLCLLIFLRCVIHQSRHAVDVSDPQRLVRWMEAILGTSHLEGEILEAREGMQQRRQQIDQLQQSLSV